MHLSKPNAFTSLLHRLPFSFFMGALNAFRSSCSPSREPFYTSTEESEFFFRKRTCIFPTVGLFLATTAEALLKTCIYIFMCSLLFNRTCPCVIYTLLYSTSSHESRSVQRKLWKHGCVGKSMSNPPANDFYTTLKHCLASMKSSLETLLFHFT